MADWPDSTAAIAAIGVITDDSEDAVDIALAAARDYLERVCCIPVDGDNKPVVPDAVVQACLMLTARLFRRRQSPEGVAGFGEFGAVRVARADPDIELLISPHLAWGVA